MASVYPNKFGPEAGIDSRDLRLFMQPPDGLPTDPAVDLLGHGVASPQQNLTDALTLTTVKLRNGRVVPVTRIKRAAQETSRNYTIQFPSAVWTPAHEAAFSGCPYAFYLLYNCPEDRIYSYWDTLEDSILNPPIEAGDLVTINEDVSFVNETSQLTTPGRRRGFVLGFENIFDAGGTVAYHDIVFGSIDCPECGARSGFDLFAVGGDGTAVPLVTDTADRFNSNVARVIGSVAAQVARAVWTEGNIVAVATSNAAFTTSDLRVSRDGGVTWAAVTGVTDVIRRIKKFGNVWVMVGGTVAAGGYVALSFDDFATVTEVTNTNIPTDQPLFDVAFDEATGKVYIVGGGGTLLSGRFSGSILSLSDVSANLPGAPGDLNAVQVLAKNLVVVGGAAGYVAQSSDGGATTAKFKPVAFPSTSAVKTLDGNRWRLILGAGTKVFERSMLTKNVIEAVTLENGQTFTGNVTRVVMNRDDDFNRFAVCTDAGEVGFGKSFVPNS